MRPKKKTKNIIFHNQAGFTLIELLISIVILTVGILGLIKVVDSVIFYQDKSRDNSRAALFVTNKIEEIKRLSTNEPAGGIYGFDYLVRDYANEIGMDRVNDNTYSIIETIDEGNGYTVINRSLTFRTYPPDEDISFSDPELINLLEVIVKAEWIDNKGGSQDFEMGSLIHRRQFIE
jgi:prepilin-type N-terminal cleavage/methylation domain-containing protein